MTTGKRLDCIWRKINEQELRIMALEAEVTALRNRGLPPGVTMNPLPPGETLASLPPMPPPFDPSSVEPSTIVCHAE